MFDAMDATGLDTLKATRTLEAAGFETSQAEALVAVFGGPVAGSAATKSDVRDLRLEMKDLRTELKTEIAQLRDETNEGIADCRIELKAEIVDCRTEIAGLRDETKAEFATRGDEIKTEFAKLRDELKAEWAERRGDVARLSREIAEVRGDIKHSPLLRDRRDSGVPRHGVDA